MYNIKSKDIFDLIKSMNKSDKRYFKIYSNRYRAGEKNYVKLFDCFDKMSVYDETVIQKFFSGKGLLKQLPRMKNYLYNLILDSLEANVARDTVAKQVRKLFNQVETLCNMSLYDQGLKILEKAKLKAYQGNDLLKSIEIFDIEYRLILRKGDINDIQSYIRRFQAEFNKYIEKYVNLQKYGLLSLRIEPVLYMKPGKSGKIKKMLQPIMKDTLLTDIDKALTHMAKTRFYHIHTVNSFLSGQTKKACESLNKSVIIFEKYMDQCGGPANYVNTLHNLFIIQFMLNKFDEALQTNKRIEELLNYSIIHFGEAPVKIMWSNYERKLNLYLILGKIKESVKTIEITDAYVKNNFYRFGNVPLTYYNYLAAVCFFLNGEYSNALSRVNIILNKHLIDYFQDDQVGAHILNLLIHYELGNQEILDNQIRNTERYLKNLRKQNHPEELMINYFKVEYPKINGRTELINSMKKLKRDLEIITINPIQEDNLSPVYWMAWLESKIEKRTLSETYKDMISLYVNKKGNGNTTDVFRNG
ncbi:MAG: hypothetical protein HYU69_01500 [Bacteroidetes bacterium]|nr:hypothetical protein [Bacteroidota bacterium]